MIRLNQRELIEITDYMRTTYGIDLSKKQTLIECRMVKELERLGCDSFGAYIQKLKNDKSGELADELVIKLTTNYTYFMREPEHFRLLGEKIFPEAFSSENGVFYHIWCAGCSTGEECYTLAMVLKECEARGMKLPNIRITASDISEEVLRKAEEGRYPLRELEPIPVEWRKKYCQMEGKDHFYMNRELKSNIRFVKQNLMDPSSERYDLIICRNVMIYFDRESRRKLVKKFERSLNPGGYLLVGHAELLSGEDTELNSVYPAIYKKEKRISVQTAKEGLWKRK